MARSTLIYAALISAGLGLLAAVIAVVVLPIQPPLSGGAAVTMEPNVEVTLYAGEIEGAFAFGLSPDNLTSPGPTLRFKLNDVVKITLVNVGRIPHTFAVTERPVENSRVLFNSEIGSVSSPVQPGSELSIVFVASQPGEFAYICTVPGHAALGMKGKVIIEG